MNTIICTYTNQSNCYLYPTSKPNYQQKQNAIKTRAYTMQTSNNAIYISCHLCLNDVNHDKTIFVSFELNISNHLFLKAETSKWLCDKHKGTTVTHFCISCRTPLCSQCFVDIIGKDVNSHSKHIIHDLDKALEEIKKCMQG